MAKQQSLKQPPQVSAEIGGLDVKGGLITMSLPAREFKSGNHGWYGQQRLTLVDGSTVNVQVTIVHKPAK